MTLHLTRSVVLTALEEVVAENGEDHKYVGPDPDRPELCVYAEGTKPSCIWGHVMAKLDPEAFAEVASDEFLNHAGIGTPQLPIEWESERLKSTAEMLQNDQDRGYTWGVAVSNFKDGLMYSSLDELDDEG